MPEVERDPAAAYVMAKGIIRASNDSTEWINAFKSDIVSFFVSGISVYAGNLLGSTNFSTTGGVIQIQSTSQLDFKFEVSYDDSNNCIVKLKWGTMHEHILIDNFNISSKHPIYWAVYRGTIRTGESGSEIAAGYSPDIMVVMARDGDKNLTGSVSSYIPPTDAEWETIIDNMCKYSPASFMIVNVLNSLTNDQSGAGVVAFTVDSISPSEAWTADTSWEPGYRITTDPDSGHRIGSYYASRHAADPGFSASAFLTGDMPYYPLPSGYSAHGYGMLANNIAPIYYKAPMWSPASACVTVNTLRQVWGGKLDPDGVEPNIPHVGPELLQDGDNYYLRCYDMWMLVAPPPESEQEPEE